MRRENPLCAIGNVDDANASVIATGKTADRTGDGSAVRRPCRPAEKEIRMLSCGDFLLSRAVCIRNYYGVFAFTHITTLKSETFSVWRHCGAANFAVVGQPGDFPRLKIELRFTSAKLIVRKQGQSR